MKNNPQFWQTWADALHRWGLDNLAAALLETSGPLTLLGAQLVYLSQPVFGQFFPREHTIALAKMLEQPELAQAFSAFLRNHTNSS